MEIKDLSGKDICAIIKSCSQANVRELSIGQMSIKFGTTSQGEPTVTAPIEGTQTLSTPETEVSANLKTEQQESFVDAIKSRMDEEVMQTQTLMDDPVQFEADMVNSLIYDKEDSHVTEERR